MDETKEDIIGKLSKIAEVSDNIKNIFNDNSVGVIVELPDKEFKLYQSMFRSIDSSYNKFKINMSGIEFLFINIEIDEKTIEESKNKNILSRIISFFGKK